MLNLISNNKFWTLVCRRRYKFGDVDW